MRKIVTPFKVVNKYQRVFDTYISAYINESSYSNSWVEPSLNELESSLRITSSSLNKRARADLHKPSSRVKRVVSELNSSLKNYLQVESSSFKDKACNKPSSSSFNLSKSYVYRAHNRSGSFTTLTNHVNYKD